MGGWTLSERFDTNDGTVRWGKQGSGSPVVLLHGTPFSSMVWRDIAVALAAHHEVYVWDMLGYGQSDMHEGQDVSLGTQQKIFSALLEHWGLDAPAVVAHDFEGTVALRTMLLSGNRYSRLALFDSVALGHWGTGFFRLARDNQQAFTNLPEYLHEAMLRSYISTASHHGLPSSLADELARPWLGSTGQAAFYRQIAQNDERFTREIESNYAKVDLPSLIGWGTQDTWLSPAIGTQLAERIPDAELRLFESAGHLIQVDAPAQVTAALNTFL